MKTSSEGINLIKSFESCKLVAYKALPTEKYYTIGWGHYGSDVYANMTITQAQADLYLVSDLVAFEQKVNKYQAKYNWNQSQYDALVSFAYNVGSIDQLTANGTRSNDVIAKKMLEYVKSGGRTIPGLVKRRQTEQALFLKNGIVTTSGVKLFSLKNDGNKQVSENFKVKEFKCKDGADEILIDVEFVKNKLQKIRNHFAAPVNINSAYRTTAYNSLVGGAKNSYHKKGQAFDIRVTGHSPLEVAQYAYSIGIKGIILYSTFVHVDSRTTTYYAKNTNGKVTNLKGF